MLLPGRDGWISRILDILKPDFGYIHVCASRRVYKLAAVENEDDISQMLDEDYKGSRKELYALKFHISTDEGESEIDRFRRVMQEASGQREYLIRYLESSGVQKDLQTSVFVVWHPVRCSLVWKNCWAFQHKGFILGRLEQEKQCGNI